jgi:hypothetical protein
MKRNSIILVLLILLISGCSDILDNPDNDDNNSALVPVDNPGLPVSILDLPLYRMRPEMIIESTNPGLLITLMDLARTAADEGPRAFKTYIGLNTEPYPHGEMISLVFDPNNPEVMQMIEESQYDIASNPDLKFYAVNMVLVDKFVPDSPEGNKIRVNNVSPEVIENHSRDTVSGGCCAILAVAHSLVRRMGRIVPKDSALEKHANGKYYWKPEFLKKIWKNSGDKDNHRGLYDNEAEAAHSADYNSEKGQEQIDDDKPLFNKDANTPCSALKDRYNALKARLDANNDVTMRIQGYDGSNPDSNHWGHRVMVSDVKWVQGPPCSMKIIVVKTSVQDSTGKHDFKNIPYEPGTATYEIKTDKDGKTTVTQNEFDNSEHVTGLQYDTFRGKKK